MSAPKGVPCERCGKNRVLPHEMPAPGNPVVCDPCLREYVAPPIKREEGYGESAGDA